MTLHIRYLLLTLALCASAIPVQAERGFNPTALAADWWSHFRPNEDLSREELTQRIEAAKSAIAASVNASPDSEALASTARRIDAGFNRYLSLITAPPAEPEAQPVVAQESYTLDEALARFDAWRTLDFQIQAEAQDLDWERNQLAVARKLQTRRRGEYLALDAADMNRLRDGLSLVSGRLENEIHKTAQSARKKQLAAAQSRLDLMSAEIRVLAERLQPAPEDIESRQLRQQKLGASIEKLTLAQEQADSRMALSGESTLTEDANLQLLISTQRSLDLATYEAQLHRARAAEALLLLLSRDATVNADANRELIASTRDAAQQWQAVQTGSERIVDRTRRSIAPLLDDEASATQQLRNRLLRELEKTGQQLATQATSMARTDFMIGLLESRQNMYDGWLVQSLKLAETTLQDAWTSASGWLTYSLVEINETPVTALGLLRMLLILAIAIWVSKLIRSGLKRIGERGDGGNQSALYTLGRLIHYTLLVVGIVMGLSSIGIDFTKFALFASALGVGIGFGLQTLISNFVSGLIILFEKSLKVHDYVELESGVTGEVREINMRSTLITTNDNIDILVPNSEFVAGRVINWTMREAYRRIHVPFGVAYGSDKEKVKRAALAAAEAVPHTLTNSQIRAPQVWLTEFGDSSINYELVLWLLPTAVKSPGAVQAAYLWELETQLRIHQIEIPFPQQDLHLKSLFGLKDEAARKALHSDQDTEPT